MSIDGLKSQKDEVLNETVAQDIFRELTDLRAYVDVHGKRWVLELIQNALDVSVDDGVDIEIDLIGSKLSFSHNGRSFTEKELIHLIYHGSTKIDTEGSSGKLGTGFLASHLLSPQVTVRGSLCDRQSFEFILDRQADTVAELTGKMKLTWDQLLKSLGPVSSNSKRLTSYEYTLDTAEKLNIFRMGTDIIKETAPILLGLDTRLQSITINQGSETLKWTKAKRQGSNIVDICLLHNGVIEKGKIGSIITFFQGSTTLAIPLYEKDGKLTVSNVYNMPKLYYPLPLIGSSSFPFPFLISNRDFVPTKDREGVLLTSSTEIRINKQAIENAFELIPTLLGEICRYDYGDLHFASRIHPMEELENNCSKWLDKGWIQPLVVKMVEKFRDSPILLTAKGLREPRHCKVPFFNDNQNQDTSDIIRRIWMLGLQQFPDSLPTTETYDVWHDILTNWLTYYQGVNNEVGTPFGELLTIEKICQIVEEKAVYDELQKILGEFSATAWLNDLFSLVNKASKESLFDSKEMLPNQNKRFCLRDGMYCDNAIPEELKDIITMLGRDVRNELLMVGIVTTAITNSRTEQEIRLEALKKIKDQAKSAYLDRNYQQANVKFLSWLVNTGRFDDIRESYPIFSHGMETGEEEFVFSFASESKFLVPEISWNNEKKQFLEVFPPRAVLSNVYSLTADQWKVLGDNSLVFQDFSFPLTTTLNNKQVRVLSLDDILENDQKEHKSLDKIPVKSIPFLVEKDWGVLDRLTGKERTLSFLRFILEDLIKEDDSWKIEHRVRCSCGLEHSIHPSIWLESLRTRQWVPVSGGKGEKPSSENLTEYFSHNSLMDLLKNEEVRQFIGTLGINVSILMTANKTGEDKRKFDQAFSALLTATGMNPEELTKLADACSDQDLRSRMFQAYANKKIVLANQKVGKIVEEAIRKVIRERMPTDQFEVKKVHRGSDVKVTFENVAEDPTDYVDDGGIEWLLQISDPMNQHLIEIKSARTDSVRMTVPQAKQAFNASNSFTLCVVDVTSDILTMSEEEATSLVVSNSHFVFPIGDKFASIIKEIDDFEKGETALAVSHNEEMEVDISEVQIRVRINRVAWQNALSLNNFIDLLFLQRSGIVIEIKEKTNA